MPLFKEVKSGKEYWFPLDRLARMETGPGGLTTVVAALTVNEKGPALVVFEAEGRISTLAAALDRGEPTEVGN